MEITKKVYYYLKNYANGWGNRKYLSVISMACGINARTIREIIHELRDAKIPVCADTEHGGYFLADLNNEKDKSVVKRFVIHQQHKIINSQTSLKPFRRLL